MADNSVFDKGTQIKCVKLIQIVFSQLLSSLIVSYNKTLGRGSLFLLDIINPYFNIMFTIIADNGSDLNLLMFYSGLSYTVNMDISTDSCYNFSDSINLYFQYLLNMGEEMPKQCQTV